MHVNVCLPLLPNQRYNPYRASAVADIHTPGRILLTYLINYICRLNSLSTPRIRGRQMHATSISWGKKTKRAIVFVPRPLVATDSTGANLLIARPN